MVLIALRDAGCVDGIGVADQLFSPAVGVRGVFRFVQAAKAPSKAEGFLLNTVVTIGDATGGVLPELTTGLVVPANRSPAPCAVLISLGTYGSIPVLLALVVGGGAVFTVGGGLRADFILCRVVRGVGLKVSGISVGNFCVGI